jgi:glyoxylase-like metal-dependent hydrolase (beta-lactamase superfamily II)
MIDKYNGLIVEQITVGMMEVNCYLVYDSVTKEGIVVDPGDEGSHIMRRIEEQELKIGKIVLTHGHGDHIGAVEYVRKRLKALLAIGKDDAEMITNAALNHSDALGMPITLDPAEILLSEGDTVAFGSHSLKVVETPGHTRGGITLIGDGFVICGDLVFAGSIGRVDFPGGDYKTIIDSIKRQVLALGDKTVIYPGHGPKTDVAQEKVFNPFLIGG